MAGGGRPAIESGRSAAGPAPTTPPGLLDGLYGDPTSDVSVQDRAGFVHVDQGGVVSYRRGAVYVAPAQLARPSLRRAAVRSTYPLQLANCSRRCLLVCLSSFRAAWSAAPQPPCPADPPLPLVEVGVGQTGASVQSAGRNLICAGRNLICAGSNLMILSRNLISAGESVRR